MIENKIISFLEEILEKLKNKNLDESELIKITEFYLSYNFLNNDHDDYSDKDMVNFLSLGWYIYENHVKNIK
jgi:hypothetical protein